MYFFKIINIYRQTYYCLCGRHGELMVSVFGSRASSLDMIPDWGYHVAVLLGKTLYSHSASLHSGVLKWALANLMLGSNPAMD